MCAHMHTFMHVTVRVWRSEDNLQELVLSFHYVGSGDQTQWSGLVASAFIH